MPARRDRIAVMMVFGTLALGLAGFAPGVDAVREKDKEVPAVKLEYPKAPVGDTVDVYHGVSVPDPHRALENPDAPETKAWVDAENKVTFAFLESIPARAKLKARLSELWNYEKFGVPFREGSRWFFSKNSGLQNQSVVYWTDDLAAEPRVLIDPNTLSTDGTVALSGLEVSPNGSLVAYGTASAGSDWQVWRVRDVATGRDLDDRLDWIKFSGVSWTKDGKGFYYGRFPEPPASAKLEAPNYFQKLYHHVVGRPQSEDRLIIEAPDHKEWSFHGEVTDDGRYLVITVQKGTDDKFRILYLDLEAADAKPVELIGGFENEYSFIDNDGPVFWFKTNESAPRGRVVAIDVRRPEKSAWREVIPQAAETLQGVSTVGGRFLANYLRDARSQVKVFGLDGRFEREVELPGLGTASGFGGKRGDAETFYAFTSYVSPTTIYRHEVATGKSTVFRRPKVAFDPDAYESKQVFVTSKDGTKLPMIISSKKGLKLDGANPTLLYGYGGFNISLTPAFSPANLVWMEMGGVFAVPNLRGGGEYGEEWHQAGTKLRKQNVFDDFIASAEWLIAEKYTSTPRLAIAGGSNGGLLVGACMTQRPDLFGAALPAVGVMDMLRFHRFTIGWAWIDDYGSSDDPEQFKALRAYSPLHNLKPGTAYPATMVTTADHDDRVVPAHSFKFAAALQAAHSGSAPVLIRIETKAGHGAGKPTSKSIEEAADRWAFLSKVLEIPQTP
ncbi:MAG: prolyl oligopeptidase family serine peptidase [Isosphaeraceae bacterium]|nr:prolyl oligopeptidase family serine peptidase [Isosphaeraceae bacterium]